MSKWFEQASDIIEEFLKSKDVNIEDCDDYFGIKFDKDFESVPEQVQCAMRALQALHEAYLAEED